MNPYYQDEAVTLYCGDCRDILPTITADMTLTDPPYNVGLDYCAGDRRSDYDEWLRSWFTLCPRPLVFTPGTVNLGRWFAIESPQWVCAWLKPNQCSRSPLGGFNVWEPLVVYGKPRRRVGHDAWTCAIRTRQKDTGDHPCPKDLPAWRACLERFSLPGDMIADPFAGSGTTLVAAKQLGRRAIGIEIEERYCAIAAERLAATEGGG